MRERENIVFSIPLQQMLDINDLIWYCSEIRHQIEKKRYQSANNLHPLLKYVRSASVPRSRSNSHLPPPLPPTTTTATASSAYSFSNVLSQVNPSPLDRNPLRMDFSRQVRTSQHELNHHHRFSMFNNNSKWNVLI